MTRRTTLLTLGAAAFAAAPAAAQDTLAFSEANGIEIVALGDPWCRSTLELQFRLSETSPLRDEATMTQFAPRLAPVFEAECPEAGAAEVRLTDVDGEGLEGRPAYRMASAQGWAMSVVREASGMSSLAAALQEDNDAPSATTEAPPPGETTDEGPPPDEIPEAVFTNAEPITNEGYLQTIFHFAPQYADVSRFENTPVAIGGLYACELQQRALRGDEFAARQLRADMEPVIADLRGSAAQILEREFRIQYETSLGEYVFDDGAFPVSPFEGRLNLGGFEEPRGCRVSMNDAIPFSFSLTFSEDAEVDQLSMSREAAQSYLEDMRRRNYGQREVLADLIYRVVGFEVNGRAGTLTVEPVALRLLHRTTQETLLSLDRDALESQRQAAEQRRLEAQRQAEIERRQAEAQRLREQRDSEIEFMSRRLENTARAAERIFMVHSPEDARTPDYDHPSLIAAQAERFGEAQIAVVLFQAGRTRDDITNARWPTPLRVDVRDRSVELPLSRGDWYLAYGELDPDPDAADLTGLSAALLEAEWVFACASDGCEEESAPEALLDHFEERLDARIEAMQQGEES